MNKSDLIDQMARHADISKASAERALNQAISAITLELRAGNEVTLQGFGKFSVIKRAERQGRDPRTGAAITIAASKAPKFTPGKALKDAVN